MLGLLNCKKTSDEQFEQKETNAKEKITIPLIDTDEIDVPLPFPEPIKPLPLPVPGVIPVDPGSFGNSDDDNSCADSDADGVCDTKDKCQGSDDRIDDDKDGWPKVCDCDDENADSYPDVECNPSVAPNNQECRHLICRVSFDRGGNQVAACANEPKEDFTLCGNEPLGLCDKQDFCYSGLCVNDKHDITYQCSNYVSECDVPDYCNGVDIDCPNTYVAEGIACGNDAQSECDAQDECDGQGGCVDRIRDQGYVCRSNSLTGCDVTDVCNGFDKECPNTVLASGTLCGNSSQGECDLHDVCNSQGECIDIKRLPGAICEFAHGICQPGSTCDGLNNDCPFAQPSTPGTPCGPGLNFACDGQGSCSFGDNCPNTTGTGLDNDGDTYSTDCDCNDGDSTIFPGAVCSSNVCSQNICNADTQACDIVVNYDAGTACGPDQPPGSCLKNPVCDGNGTCNSDFQNQGHVCRVPTGVCDEEEVCSGSSSTCPPDIFKTGIVCGSETDPCLSPGTCDGTSANCSGSVNAPDGITYSICDASALINLACGGLSFLPDDGYIICSQGVGYCYFDNNEIPNTICYGTLSNNINGSTHDDLLGYSVAAYGNYVASGNISYDLPANGGDDVGAVYVSHVVDPSSASAVGSLIVSNPTITPSGLPFPQGGNRPTGDHTEQFGWSVALHGDYLIVGAPRANYYYDADTSNPCTGAGTPESCLTDTITDTGAAYIFIRNGVDWQFQAKLQGALVRSAGDLYPDDVDIDDSDLHTNDYFGWDVAINGDYAVVSAPFAEGANDDVGNVRVYHRSGSTWSHLQVIGTPVDLNDNQQFGYAVSISPNGQALAVSMPFFDNDSTDDNDDRGIVYFYNSNGTGGTFTRLTSSPSGQSPDFTGFSGGDRLGFDIALNNSFIVIGVPHRDTNSYDNNGEVYFMNYDTNGFYSGTFKTFNGLNSFNQNSLFFGTSVSVSRTDEHAFVVGTPYYDVNSNDTGLFAVYSIDQSLNTVTAQDFKLVSYVNGGDFVSSGGSQFGFSVATDNNIIAVGAPYNDTTSGDTGSTSLFFYPY